MKVSELKNYFHGKRVTVMGLGLLGRGVGDTKFLAEMGANLVVTDLKKKEELEESLKQLRNFSNITYRLGEHHKEDFQDKDFILKSAGVPFNSPFIAEARKNKIPIEMSASLFVKIAKIPLVGVTGTRGKSTTTHLLHEIILNDKMQVILGGNVRGLSNLALLKEVDTDKIALMELDSWQLQGFGEAGISPSVAVFTTFFPDHLNYYGGDMALYLRDKANIFINQTEADTLVLGKEVSALIKEKYKGVIKSRIVVADEQKFPKSWQWSLPGAHNRLNAMCAIEAARAIGISDDTIKEAVARFKGVPGRLEFLKEVQGIKIYNDTTATTPEATIAAMRALSTGKQNIILIMGGADKGLDMSSLMAEVPLHSKKVVLLSGTGTEKIKDHLKDAFVHSSLESAFEEAYASSERGDIILFSPSFASFGMFKNEFDRGDRFCRLVDELA